MKLIIFFLILTILRTTFSIPPFDNEVPISCDLPKDIVQEIESYTPVANKIMRAIIDGNHKAKTFEYLAEFVDKFGARFTGTQNLEDSLDFIANKSQDLGLENVHFENVTVPRWIRGKESATLIQPRNQELRMLGLGYSVGTGPGGIEAEAIVVEDFDELRRVQHKVKGKIVVYDQVYTSYPDSVEYRRSGATEASKYGAVAALINSVTPFSLNTPHTGMQTYKDDVKKIPAACITPQGAHMLRRMQNRGQKLVINLKMDAKMETSTTSRNTIAEIRGNMYPEKVVLLSGHIDSWDIGQGAMDDGGGSFVSWNSLVVLKSLGLRARRTLRVVLWTAEEMGLLGSKAYADRHKNELDKFTFVMESDEGTFTPTGMGVSGTPETMCIVQEILNLLEPINTTCITTPSQGPDINFFTDLGVPGGSLKNKNKNYFVFHHSEADTMDVEDPLALDLGTALFSVVSYVIADLSIDLPKILKV